MIIPDEPSSPAAVSLRSPRARLRTIGGGLRDTRLPATGVVTL